MGGGPRLRTVASGSCGANEQESIHLTDLLDALFGLTPNSILYRGPSGWAVLAPGAVGSMLVQDANGNLAWLAPGTSTQTLTINAGTGLPTWT